MTAQTFTDRGEKIDVVTEEEVVVIKKNRFGRFCAVIANNPIRSALAILATGGAGYLAYDAVRSGRAKAAAEHVADAATAVSHFA